MQTKDFFIKPLNKDIAIERGVEFFYESLIYAILIVVPIIEMINSQNESE